MISEAGYTRTSRRARRDNSDRWLLTYADLITLLLAFFVIMYGMSSTDAQKFSKMAESMRRAFNVGVLQGGQDVSVLEQAIAAAASQGVASEAVLEAESRDLEMIYSEMGWIFQQEGLGDRVSLSLRPEGIAVSLSGNLLFASGRAELRPDALRLLQSLGKALSRLPNPIRVEGHTDDVPPNGTGFPSNWELSGARAVAIVRHLAEVEGLDPRRLSAMAYSQYQPVAPNDSARARAQNRRSEILILYPAAAAPAAMEPPAGAVGRPAEREGERNGVAATR